ncbi:MAG TPA: AAA family ATPase [Ktedonobacteraceae bacterium]
MLNETGDSPHLITERDALGFDFRSAFELDIHTLQTSFKLARARSSVEGLQAAVELYRGDFLDGFSLDDAPDFDDWMRLQRETWHQRMSTVLNRLSQLHFDAGEMADAIETTTRWVTHEPLNEVGYQRLMQVHFAVGDRNAALSAYETCRNRLAKELRAQPEPETKALAERIRAKAPPRHASSPTLGTPQTMPPLSTLASVPLIGRAAEYGRLIEAFHAAMLGQTQVVLLTGEAGIGKTRLANEFLGWAAAHDADVLQGRAFEMGGQLPYQALVDALRGRVERENAPEDLLSDTWLAELSRLLPELRDRYPDLPLPTADEATARIRLFESVARLLQALAEREPIVLIIDDMHWADIATLDILHYAGRRWQESKTPLLLLVSLRAGTLLREPALGSWLASLEHDLHTTSLTIGPLVSADTGTRRLGRKRHRAGWPVALWRNAWQAVLYNGNAQGLTRTRLAGAAPPGRWELGD